VPNLMALGPVTAQRSTVWNMLCPSKIQPWSWQITVRNLVALLSRIKINFRSKFCRSCRR